jgi:TRAP-type C4-dicarboxylate transport system substrate-binding protein
MVFILVLKEIGNNEIVSQVWYDELTPEFKDIVDKGGTAALDIYINNNYVTTKTDELIDKNYFNSLTAEQKDYITNYELRSSR